jgi:hypothetical protein
VSPATVEAGQFLAHIDDPQVHKTAARLGTEFLGRVHERRSDSSLLVAWIHRQQAEVSAFALEFNIDTAQECVTVLGQPFGEQKLSRFHQRLHRIDVIRSRSIRNASTALNAVLIKAVIVSASLV